MEYRIYFNIPRLTRLRARSNIFGLNMGENAAKKFMISNLFRQDTLQRRSLILNGSVTATILMLSLPTLMMGIVQGVIPLIDGLFLNNLAGIAAAGAVSYCIPIINIITGLAQGLSVAGMAIIGQANGRGDLEEGRRVSVQMIAFASAMGAALAPVLFFISAPIAAGVDPDISGYVRTYLSLSAIALPFSFLESVYNAIRNAGGKPEATLLRMLILLALKAVFNCLFIAVFDGGVAGCALSTIVSNVLITAWMYYELFVKKSNDRLSFSGFRPEKYIISSLIRIGLPSMLTGAMINLGFFLINHEVQKYGAVVLDAQGIAVNISAVSYIVPASFSSAVTVLVSMNAGAGNAGRAKAACWKGCAVSAIAAAVLIAAIAPLARPLALLFTRDPEVVRVAERAMHIYIFSIIGFGVGMVQMGAYVGLGRTRMPLFIGVLRIWLLRYLFILATQSALGVDAVFWGNLFSNYACAVISTALVLKVKWVSVIGAPPSFGAGMRKFARRIRCGADGGQKGISS